jgi:hypothetical protein
MKNKPDPSSNFTSIHNYEIKNGTKKSRETIHLKRFLERLELGL